MRGGTGVPSHEWAERLQVKAKGSQQTCTKFWLALSGQRPPTEGHRERHAEQTLQAAAAAAASRETKQVAHAEAPHRGHWQHKVCV